MGGRAAAQEVSKNVRRRGAYLPSERRLRRERVCEGVVIFDFALSSANREHSRMMWVGERVGSPHGQRMVSGGSDGRKHDA